MDEAKKRGVKIYDEENYIHIPGENSILSCNIYIYLDLCIYNVNLKQRININVKCLAVKLPKGKDIIIGRETLQGSPELKAVLFSTLCTGQDDITWMKELIQAYEERPATESDLTWDANKKLFSQRLRDLEEQRRLLDIESELMELTSKKRRMDIQMLQPFPQGLSRRKYKKEVNYRKSAAFTSTVNTLLLAGKAQPVPLPDAAGGEIPSDIQGSSEFIEQQRAICNKYAQCFSSKLRHQNADIPPLELQISDEWESKENRRPARLQGPAKETDIKKQTTTMLEAGVIRLSTAGAHSHVLLIPKPDGTWRFCIDYRRLNACTTAETWPIPNIQQMLRDIGDRKPKYFGLMDLTKGYYQAPLSEASKHYTAFITASALYEWNRVPMGLMGAPSYFQRIMTSIVLAGLIGHSCAVYIDDIIIYGTTTEEYLKNLELVLMRLSKHRLTVNPGKTHLGLREIEYVGHIIDDKGLTFSRERLQEIIDFPLPETLGNSDLS
jgi:hypothetical protein